MNLFRPHRHARVLLGLVLPLVSVAGPAFAAKTTAVESPPEDHIELPKMEVKARTVCSFGIGVVAIWNKQTQLVTHLYIDEVSPGSTAEQLGLARGDEILTINRRKVSTMKGGIRRGTELFELLVNQPHGKKINLEVTVRATKRVTLDAAGF